jgi:hypothetical protein
VTTDSDAGWLDAWWDQNVPPRLPDETAEREAARLAALAAVSDQNWKPVPELEGCTFSAYQASDRGQYRSVDRVANGRRIRGQVLATTPSKDGYVRLNLYCDNPRCPKRGCHKITGHKVTLTAFAGPCPPGMETCHGSGGPADNRWPENIRWGTKKENAEDQFLHGRPRAEVKPDKHCILCGLAFTTKGRRCEPCRIKIGKRAAAMLRAGMNLDVVTARAGYRKPSWVHEMARQFGGYEGTLEQAEAQGRSLPRRAVAALRYAICRGVTLP